MIWLIIGIVGGGAVATLWFAGRAAMLSDKIERLHGKLAAKDAEIRRLKARLE